jgi:uncharacterized protein YjbJ (UPF0337 family)
VEAVQGAREQWGKITDDDDDRGRRKRIQTVGLVQEKYGQGGCRTRSSVYWFRKL